MVQNTAAQAVDRVLADLQTWPDTAAARLLGQSLERLNAAQGARGAAVQRLIDALDAGTQTALTLPDAINEAVDVFETSLVAAIANCVDKIRAQAEEVAERINTLAREQVENIETLLDTADEKVVSASDTLINLADQFLGQADRALDALDLLANAVDRGVGDVSDLIGQVDAALQPIRPLIDQMEALA